MQDIITPAETAPDGLPRLWAMCTTLTTYSTETGLHGGDFWTNVANEYDARTGPVRDAIEAAMSWWMHRLEDLIAAGIEPGQLTPATPPSSPSKSRPCSTPAATTIGSTTTPRRRQGQGPPSASA